MSERPIDLTAQLLAHLQSLRAAGVLFVPRGPVLDIQGLINPAASPEPALMQPPLFERAQPIAQAQPDAASLFTPPAQPAPSSQDGRRRALEMLTREVEACDLCGELYSTRTQTVFGTGPIGAEVAFVGEAPGADEDREGQPFVGRAGQLLTRIITRCGFHRKDVYIMNTLKCRPPNNRIPNSTECSNCRPYFERQFDLIQPKFVVALGATAAKHMLQTTDGIGMLRGRVFEYRGRPLVCTYHPSALLRDETRGKWWECWEDMKVLLRLMGRPVPEEKGG